MQTDSSQHWVFRVPKKPVRLAFFFGFPILVVCCAFLFLKSVVGCPNVRIEEETLAPLFPRTQVVGVSYVMRYLAGGCTLSGITERYQVVRFYRGNQVAVKEIFWGYPHVVKWQSGKTLRVCQFGANQFSKQDSFDEPWYDIVISYRLGGSAESSDNDRAKICSSP
jgi:hypothetical protein